MVFIAGAVFGMIMTLCIQEIIRDFQHRRMILKTTGMTVQQATKELREQHNIMVELIREMQEELDKKG